MQISHVRALLLSLMLSIVGVIALAPSASAATTSCPPGPTRFYNSVSWYDWSPRSYGPGRICIQNSRGNVIFQSDGNLVIYGNVPGRDGRYPLWAR